MLGVTFEKTLVVSALGAYDGARLDLLKQCLQHLSSLTSDGKIRVVAFVSDPSLFPFPGIEFKEVSDGKRLYWDSVLIAEQDDKPIDLWLSFFDTTPHVQAQRQAVFCSNPFPWLDLRPRDWVMDKAVPKAVYAARAAYRKNVSHNSYLIVQQDYFRKKLSRLVRFDESKIIVFPSSAAITPPEKVEVPAKGPYLFFYPSTPDCYKNFEVVCEAARLLELEIGRRRFRLECTIRGEDNKYGWWLKSNWDHVDSIHFAGWQSPSKLWGWYEAADCLVYASRVEAWGRPISEFAPTGKPMLLADLPYAHESAAGAQKVAFFPVHDATALKEKMKALVLGSEAGLSLAPYHRIEDPKVYDWAELFTFLLSAPSE